MKSFEVIRKDFLQSIEIYINHPYKSHFLSIHHRHRDTGIRRAALLKDYILHCPNLTIMNQLIKHYLERSQELEEVLLNLKLQYKKTITKAEIKVDASLLRGGNKHPSSLWTYVNNVFQQTKNQAPIENNLSIIKNPIFDVFLPVENISKVGNSAASAHVVTRYQDKKNQKINYFVKSLNNDEIGNAIAEVIYAQIWNYFIGDRASKSLLLLSEYDKKIIGIASKGINEFQEYKSINEDQKDYPGLIQILFYVCVLIENDFHICNFGTGLFNGKRCYGKIDHDYIVSFWDTLKYAKFMTEVPHSFQELFKKKSMSSLFFLLESMRFSPVKANSRILALGHKIRPGRPSTVTSHTMMNQIRNRAITRNNQKELEYTINDFILKTRSAQINNFF